MGIEEKKSIIHRKAIGGRDEFDARMMSPVKALRLGLAKTADKMFGMALTVTTVEQVKLPHREIMQEVGDDGLLLLLDGSKGARGAIKVDIQLLTALIEVQTTGTVRSTAGEARPVTRTDAAIVAPLIDTVLNRYDEQMSEAFADHEPVGFRFGDMIEEARLLALALEEPEYDLYRLTLDLAEGAKTGVLKLLMPHRKVVAAVVEPPSDLRPGGAVCLEKNALEAPVALDAVLARTRLPLKEICEFAPGTLLPLDAECLANAKLVGSGGHVVARVRMGQMNGMRAVRFIAPAITESAKQAESPEESLPDMAGTPMAAELPALQDDALDGIATELPDLPMGEDGAGFPLPDEGAALPLEDDASGFPMADADDAGFPVADMGSLGDFSDEGADASGFEAGDELSSADLMQAANALQNLNEDA